jgi:all-trans-8'-apo-beta-carotenal 15,15'-oxygenase
VEPLAWSGGFRSLEDEHDSRINDLDGIVPVWLRGTLFRNGSGRNQLDGKWFPHWFDGDGMISAIRFDDDGVRYANRFVKTENYLDETRAGTIVHRGFGKMRPHGMLGNVFRQPANVSNTSVLVHDGRLLSLWEGGAPFELDPVTLETRRPETFDGKVKAFSAHPKVDPATGEIFNFGIDYGPRTRLTIYRLDHGGMQRIAAVALPYPVMNHDFVLTEHHLVFCLGPILVRSARMILGLASFDGALEWDGGKPTRILIVRRDGSGAPHWIETDAFFQFHFANGFEQDGALVLDLARYPDFATIGEALRTYWRSEWPSLGMARLTRLRVDLANGKVESRTFDTGTANEFPRIDPRRVGRRYRYAYIANKPSDSAWGLQHCLSRVDLESGTVDSHDFGQHRYPGEPFFIAKSANGPEAEGIVVTMVYDAAEHRSSIVGLDAADMSGRPLFIARLKHHVPYSLHGTFAPNAALPS